MLPTALPKAIYALRMYSEIRYKSSILLAVPRIVSRHSDFNNLDCQTTLSVGASACRYSRGTGKGARSQPAHDQAAARQFGGDPPRSSLSAGDQEIGVHATRGSFPRDLIGLVEMRSSWSSLFIRAEDDDGGMLAGEAISRP
jgi:hypothetical protein